jgi:hypothetical protein
MIRQRTSSISNLDLTGLSGWPTHESQDINRRKANSGWVKLPLDKSTKYDQTHAT